MPSDIKKLLLSKNMYPLISKTVPLVTSINDLLNEYKNQTNILITELQMKLVSNTINELPISTIALYASTIIPNNWLLCDGSLLLISDYQDLYNVIGITYGGDGLINFLLPNFSGRTPIGPSINVNLGNIGGEESHILTINELPIHNHNGTTSYTGSHNHSNTTGRVPDHIYTTNSYNNTDIYNEYGLIHKSYGGNNTTSNVQQGISLLDVITTPLRLEVYGAGSRDHIISSDGDHNHNIFIENTGLNLSHNNMQPYLVINYIIKYI